MVLFGNAYFASFIAYYEVAREIGAKFVLRNSPIVPFDTTKTRSQAQPLKSKGAYQKSELASLTCHFENEGVVFSRNFH